MINSKDIEIRGKWYVQFVHILIDLWLIISLKFETAFSLLGFDDFSCRGCNDDLIKKSG